MGGDHAARAQRVDLLGDVGEEGGDAGGADQEGYLENEERYAPAVLLGRLSASVSLGGCKI